jgi:protein gp37
MITKDGEWWDYSWNVAPGCTKVGPECEHCWALAMAKRLQGMRKPGYEGLVDDKGRWSGRVNLMPGRLEDPFRLQKPRVIAVNLMGDLFLMAVPDVFLERVFAIMSEAKRHTFMVLTKRPQRAVEFLERLPHVYSGYLRSPIRNVWIGTTAGTQESANVRRRTMAWLAEQGWNTWVSSEPRLEAIDWSGWGFLKRMVTGGESGPNARPMDPAWPRADRDWCQKHGVAFWFKAWGEWGPEVPGVDLSHYFMTPFEDEVVFHLGKEQTGRILDGRTWEEETS